MSYGKKTHHVCSNVNIRMFLLYSTKRNDASDSVGMSFL